VPATLGWVTLPADRPPAGPSVRRVLHVAKTHLDVGFTDTAAAVRRRYLDDFFPRAVDVAAELRRRGGPAQLRWTTGSWILAEALDAARGAERDALATAVEAGDLCWHAMPFTTHTEYAERSLIEHGLSISAALDRRFGRRTRAAKLTDVPGHTRGLVSLLADHGVELLHVGVNPAATAPSVPARFHWRDHAAPGGPELLVMYQPGGYGAEQQLGDTLVAIDLTGDNLGPPAADEVEARFADLAARHPGAELVAATLDDVADAMAAVAHELPVVEAEIGDSWVHGVGSAPRMTAGFRALSRQRRSWLDHGTVAADDPDLAAASTRLLLVAEHTWGLDQKTHWPDTTSWGNEQLAAARTRSDTIAFEASWAEADTYLDEYVALLPQELGPLASEELAAVRAPVADLDGELERTVPLRPAADEGAVGVDVGGFRLLVDTATGSIIGCLDPGDRQWASPDSPLGAFSVQVFDAADYERWFSTYNAPTADEDEWWARWDNTKPGLEGTAARSTTWGPASAAVRGAPSGDRAVIALEPPDPRPEAWPGSVSMVVSSHEVGRLQLELRWSGAVAARWPRAVWWSFAPVVDDPSAWRMSKLGEWVDPADVVDDGGRDLHVVERLSHPDGVDLVPLDTGLVAPGAPRLLEWGGPAPDLSGGWHLCCHANLWGTNFPMWVAGDGRFRVELAYP